MTRTISRRTMLATSTAAGLGLFLQGTAQAAKSQRRVVVWSEGTAPKKVYPKDINTAVAEGLAPLAGWEVVTASITDPEQGCTLESLNKTDVLIWWGHTQHGKVKDEYVDRIVRRVKEDGMGFIALHSSHFAKALKKLLGAACGFKAYVSDGSGLKVIVKDKQHPIAKGIEDFDMPHTERYSEPFQVPAPESVVFDGVYTLPDGSKEPSRQGLTWSIGKGKVFYFQVGHETYPMFLDPSVRKILCNAVQWAAPA